MELRNFGVFEVRKRQPRKARNPRTGEKVKTPAKLVVAFTPGRRMKERVGRLKDVPGEDQRPVRPHRLRGPKRKGVGKDQANQRPGLLPTNSPFLMTTMGRADAQMLADGEPPAERVQSGEPTTDRKRTLLSCTTYERPQPH